MSFNIKKYQSEDKSIWNSFVQKAKNATFLFDRDFMEYHSDRFEDYSLLIFEEDKLIALLPANKAGNEVFSHQGLTYGGLLTGNIRTDKFIELFGFLLRYLEKMNVIKLHVKQIPSFYVKGFHKELDYVLHICNAVRYRLDSLSVVCLKESLRLNNGRREGVKRGIKNGLVIKEEDSHYLFWNEILEPNLAKKYNVSPVHSLEEIHLLKRRFPNNIRQFNVYRDEIIVAGTTIFETPEVAHAQYISANEEKNNLGSLDFLFHYLLNEVYSEKKYFDFGPSNENKGKQINKGLLFWKEGFGAHCVVQSFYSVDTNKYTSLENVLV